MSPLGFVLLFLTTSAAMLLLSSQAPSAQVITTGVVGVCVTNFLTCLYVFDLPMGTAMQSLFAQVPLVLACLIAASQVHNCGIVARPASFARIPSMDAAAATASSVFSPGTEKSPTEIPEQSKPVNVFMKDIRLTVGLAASAVEKLKQVCMKVVNVMLSHRK
jgi:hypothetical protein